MSNEPIELLAMLADYIRQQGAHELANEVESGKVTIGEVCKRCPSLAREIRQIANKYTIGQRVLYF